MNNIIKIISRYKSVILYLFFGGCTTIINVVSYWILAHGIQINVMISTVIAWFNAVIFAFITNRKWVFESEVRLHKEILKELFAFFVCRITTGMVDFLCMFVFVDILKAYDLLVKILANIVVIIFNYIASKWFIFRK